MSKNIYGMVTWPEGLAQLPIMENFSKNDELAVFTGSKRFQTISQGQLVTQGRHVVDDKDLEIRRSVLN